MKNFTMTLSLLAFVACSSPGPTPTDVAATRAPEPAVVKDGTRVRGTVKYDPTAETKSVAAYLGLAFTLERDDGGVLVLAPSDVVPESALRAMNSQRAEVTCIMEPGLVPGPDESYPMEPDGSPMKRPERCRVVEAHLTR